MIDIDSKDNWCLSGGAIGADFQWGLTAAVRGHGVIHFSFAGQRTSVPPDTVMRLTDSQLRAADAGCRLANQRLKRRFPARSLKVTNLLRRDWYQVAEAQSCYAVSTLQVPPGPTIPLGTVIAGQVKGGTAWAVQMFIDRHQGAACPCYLFDQVLCHWFEWHGDGWRCIYEPPEPHGVYAGIGSRDLLPIGRVAIWVVMRYKNIRED